MSHLLNHSLLPALDSHLAEVGRLADRDPAEAARKLFDFSVVDPAMGSAHFLTAALDMMGDRIEIFLADIGGLPGIWLQLNELSQDSGAGWLQLEDGDLLRRLILKRCIYGVDLSPMAVEVANVTLWLASFVPGLALSYLGSNLKCGDALIGVADPSVVGASDSPFFTGQTVSSAMEQAAGLQRQKAAIPDRTPEEVKKSEELGTLRQEATAGLRAAFNLWTAEPLGLPGARYTLETYADAIVRGGKKQSADVADTVAQASGIADRYRFFHWPLEFPNIFHPVGADKPPPPAPACRHVPGTSAGPGRYSSARTGCGLSAVRGTRPKVGRSAAEQSRSRSAAARPYPCARTGKCSARRSVLPWPFPTYLPRASSSGIWCGGGRAFRP